MGISTSNSSNRHCCRGRLLRLAPALNGRGHRFRLRLGTHGRPTVLGVEAAVLPLQADAAPSPTDADEQQDDATQPSIRFRIQVTSLQVHVRHPGSCLTSLARHRGSS